MFPRRFHVLCQIWLMWAHLFLFRCSKTLNYCGVWTVGCIPCPHCPLVLTPNSHWNEQEIVEYSRTFENLSTVTSRPGICWRKNFFVILCKNKLCRFFCLLIVVYSSYLAYDLRETRNVKWKDLSRNWRCCLHALLWSIEKFVRGASNASDLATDDSGHCIAPWIFYSFIVLSRVTKKIMPNINTV